MEAKGFNPRPREGGDTRGNPTTCATSSFNPRPREGGDASADRFKSDIREFQSTPP